jgi:hypothetical protein
MLTRSPVPSRPGLIPPAGVGIVRRHAAGGEMRRTAGVALVLALLAGGCSSTQDACRCPRPVHYSNATLKKIEKAREALPRDSILQQILVDYENERDDLRFCGGAARR